MTNKIPNLKTISAEDINYMKIYTNKYDSMADNDKYKRGLKQYWGDDDKTLEVNLDTGLVEETQDDGRKVGMGYLSQENISALKKENSEYDDRGFKKNKVDGSLRYEKNPYDEYDDRGFKKNKVDGSLRYEKNPKDEYDDNGFKKNKVDGSLRYESGQKAPQSTPTVEPEVEKTVGDTVLNGLISLGEGTLRTAQNIINAGVMTANKIVKINPIVAGINYAKGGSVYKYLDEQTQSFVDCGWVDDYYDDFWENEGADIKKKSYASDAVATGGKVTGKVLFILGAAYAGGAVAGAGASGGAAVASEVGTAVATTGEVGTAVATTTSAETAVALASNVGATAAATTAATTGAAASSGAASTVIPGISKIAVSALFGADAKGETTANAWKNGASYARGDIAGDVAGAVEGGLAYAGASLNEVGASSLLKSAGAETAASYIASSGIDRIATALGTGLIGATHAAVNPASSAIANDTSYKEEFDKAGGAGSVAGSFVSSALLSYLFGGKRSSTNAATEETATPQNTTPPSGYIEDKGVPAGTNITKIAGQETSGGATNTGGTTSSANSATNTASSTTTGAAASAATDASTATANIDQEFIDTVSHKVVNTGGGANLTAAERAELAKILGINESQIINMDRSTYIDLCKKFHSDNAGNAPIFKDIFTIVNNIFHK